MAEANSVPESKPPLQPGALTEEQLKKAVQYISSFGQPPACPICGDRNWTVGHHLVQPITLGNGQDLLLGGVGYPQIMLISVKCGYTMLINAVMAGILPGSKDAGPK